mgnify:CR=1 FL=1
MGHLLLHEEDCMTEKRIVITGMGLVTPLGCGIDAVWERLIAGRSGIGRIDRFDPSDLPAQIAGQVPRIADDPAGLDLDAVIAVKERKKMDLFIVYALAAADEALRQSGWQPQSEAERDRTGTVIATGIGGFPVITEAKTVLDTRGPRRLSPFVVPSFLANLAAGNAAIRYGFKGPMGCPVTACAAGLLHAPVPAGAQNLMGVSIMEPGETNVSQTIRLGLNKSTVIELDRPVADVVITKPLTVDKLRALMAMTWGNDAQDAA